MTYPDSPRLDDREREDSAQRHACAGCHITASAGPDWPVGGWGSPRGSVNRPSIGTVCLQYRPGYLKPEIDHEPTFVCRLAADQPPFHPGDVGRRRRDGLRGVHRARRTHPQVPRRSRGTLGRARCRARLGQRRCALTARAAPGSPLAGPGQRGMEEALPARIAARQVTCDRGSRASRRWCRRRRTRPQSRGRRGPN